MNINKFLNECKANNIVDAEININKHEGISFSIFKGIIDNYSVASQSRIGARGIVNGKLGACSTEKDDKTSIEFLISGIKKAANFNERQETPIIFKGSPKYKKFKSFSEELANIPMEEKVKLAFALEKECKEFDKRVTDVEVGFEEEVSESIKANTYGLKLKTKSNYVFVYCEVVVKDGEKVKTAFETKLTNNFAEINVKELAAKTVNKALSLLEGKNIKKGKYKAVLDQGCVGTLIDTLLNNLSAEEIQKGTSTFVGKLNAQIADKKLTVVENPTAKNIFFTGFDDEAVATQTKKVIEKGVLKTYFYNLVTAAKDKVEPTGNGYGVAGKTGIGYRNVFIKPGKLTEEELFKKIDKGVYITGLKGLHAGLNPQNGNFSLESEGYYIENGKIKHALDLFTVTGNLFEMFNQIVAIGNNSKLLLSSTTAPSIAFKKLTISGE